MAANSTRLSSNYAVAETESFRKSLRKNKTLAPALPCAFGTLCMAELAVAADLPFRMFATGAARGAAVVSAEPISFAGEFDAVTGMVTGRRSALCGECLTGKILAYPHGRGSSSTSILAEALRRGTAPAAIINVTVEHILVVAALVAHELFGTSLPIIAVSADVLADIRSGDLMRSSTERRIVRHGAHRRR